MPFNICPNCIVRGYCSNRHVLLVTDDLLDSPEYIRDLKAFCHGLGVSDCAWQDYLCDLYRDFPGWIVAPEDIEVFLNMEEFERPSIREWFRDFAQVCPPDVTPRVRREARERVRIMATILSAYSPVNAGLWGIQPANDNKPPESA